MTFPLLLCEATLPPPTSEELFSWLKVAVALLGIAALARTTFRRTPPIQVEIEQKIAVVRAELSGRMDEMDSKFDALRGQITADFMQIQRSGEARAGKIHDRVNETLEAIGELRGIVSQLVRK